MSEVLEIYENVTKGVRKMIRSLILTFLVIVLGTIVLVTACQNGWLQIRITPGGAKESNSSGKIENENSEILYQWIEESFRNNTLFDLLEHVVEPGETLFDIENKYGTDWKVIQKLNRIENPMRLTAGKIIRVPVRIVDS